MDRAELTFVPEWYKSSGSSASGGSSSNHQSRSSSHSDEHSNGLPSRNKPSVSACNHDTSRSSAFGERSSFYSHRSSISNGSVSHDKDTWDQSRSYSSFGRSHRGGDREKGLDFRDRSRSGLDNGFSDSFKSSRTETDTLRRSQSVTDTWTKKPAKDLSNGAHTGRSKFGSSGKASFERDFPSLKAEGKQGHDFIRVSSHGPTTAIQSLPLGSSALVGAEGWTSALVEVPPKVGGNGPVPFSASQISPAILVSTALNPTTGLNMAEALAQAPLRSRNDPQVSVDTQRIEELTRKQYTKLIPVTPSGSKSSNFNSSDKSKSKATKGGDASAPPKVVQPPSSQVARNFHVLSRERNGILPVATDGLNIVTPTRVVTPPGIAPSAASLPKIPMNLKAKADSKESVSTSTQGTIGEKRNPQAQDRNAFFNLIRKKTNSSQSAAAIAPSGSGKDEDNCESHDATQEQPGNSVFVDVGPPDEEEAAFLRSHGWDENAEVEPLTAEEIDAFLKKYAKLRPGLKLIIR